VIWSSIFSGRFNELVVMSVSKVGFLDNLKLVNNTTSAQKRDMLWYKVTNLY